MGRRRGRRRRLSGPVRTESLHRAQPRPPQNPSSGTEACASPGSSRPTYSSRCPGSLSKPGSPMLDIACFAGLRLVTAIARWQRWPAISSASAVGAGCSSAAAICPPAPSRRVHSQRPARPTSTKRAKLTMPPLQRACRWWSGCRSRPCSPPRFGSETASVKPQFARVLAPPRRPARPRAQFGADAPIDRLELELDFRFRFHLGAAAGHRARAHGPRARTRLRFRHRRRRRRRIAAGQHVASAVGVGSGCVVARSAAATATAAATSTTAATATATATTLRHRRAAGQPER